MIDFWPAIILAIASILVLLRAWAIYMRKKRIRTQTRVRIYKEEACPSCGNSTVYRSSGFEICDSCGMITETTVQGQGLWRVK